MVIKTKELTITAIFLAVIIVQNYVLFSFPITLTYTIFYFLTRKLEHKGLPFLAVLVFVIVKNIIMPALIPTIIADIIGLCLVVATCKIKNKYLRYTLIPIIIIVHLLLLDLSSIFLTVGVINSLNDFFFLWGTQIVGSFIVYIYAPLSIILILMIDGIEYFTEWSIDD